MTSMRRSSRRQGVGMLRSVALVCIVTLAPASRRICALRCSYLEWPPRGFGKPWSWHRKLEGACDRRKPLQLLNLDLWDITAEVKDQSTVRLPKDFPRSLKTKRTRVNDGNQKKVMLAALQQVVISGGTSSVDDLSFEFALDHGGC